MKRIPFRFFRTLVLATLISMIAVGVLVGVFPPAEAYASKHGTRFFGLLDSPWKIAINIFHVPFLILLGFYFAAEKMIGTRWWGTLFLIAMAYDGLHVALMGITEWGRDNASVLAMSLVLGLCLIAVGLVRFIFESPPGSEQRS